MSGSSRASEWLETANAGACHTLLSHISEGILTVRRDGVIVFCNPRFAELFQSSTTALTGGRIDSIPNQEFKRRAALLLRNSSEPSDQFEITISHNGHSRVVRFEAAWMTSADSVAILATDVTEARERTSALAIKVDELRESRLAALNVMEDAVASARELERSNRELKLQGEANRRLATVVEQAAESIVMTDLAGTITYVNPAFERTTGYARQESVGRNPRIISSGSHPPDFYRELWATLTAGGVWHGHFVNRRKDGTLYEEEATISPVRDESGSIINYVAIKRDVTAEVALTAQLRQSQKMEAIGTLAGGVAHDFNNLLQAMMSIAQILRRKSESGAPVNVEYLAELEKAIHRGSKLTRQLLLFARRSNSGREMLDLNDIVGDLRDFLRRVVPGNVRLTVVLSPDPLIVSADRGQIEQVVTNLVVNAIDAMPNGGSLSITTSRNESSASLEVADSGSGIAPEIRDRVFEPFFTTKEIGKGTGLGLSVVHGIIASHGGNIEFDCPPDEGTKFRIALPLQNAAAEAAPAPDETIPTGQGERVLIVEDDAAARDGLSGILEILGYEFVAVGSGEEALALDDARPFAVVLTDFMLPGMSGIETVAALRRRWPDIKPVVMSGYTPPGIIESGVAARDFHFLAKPFDMTALARTLRVALGEV